MEQTKSVLLIVRIGDDYIRFREDGVERCSLNKASVFPPGEIELLRNKCGRFLGSGTGYVVRKLTIVEEPFEGWEKI